MTFDPRQVGFEWPEEIALTNPSGETMTVRPFAANFAGIEDARGHYIEGCYRYYTSNNSIITEFEIKRWLAGGPEACMKLVSAFYSLLGSQVGARRPAEEVVTSLRQQGFSDLAILLNLRWLLQGNYVQLLRENEQWSLEVLKL